MDTGVETMEKDNGSYRPCPDGQVRKDGKCVMPDITFSALVMSFNTAALLHLGEISDPGTGQKRKDLMSAKHTVDTLVMLEEKTKGNLGEDEQNLLKHVLYDLKVRFVKEEEN